MGAWLAVAVCLAAFVGCTSRERRVREHNSRGLASYEREDFEGAEEEFQQALRLDRGRVETLTNLANLQYRQGRLDRAVDYYLRALEVRPDFAMARYNLAHVYLAQGEADLAIGQFRAIEQIIPGYGQLHYKIGQAHLSRGRTAEAIASFERALEEDTGFVGARVELARALEAVDPERARAAWQDTVDLLRAMPAADPERMAEATEHLARLKAGYSGEEVDYLLDLARRILARRHEARGPREATTVERGVAPASLAGRGRDREVFLTLWRDGIPYARAQASGPLDLVENLVAAAARLGDDSRFRFAPFDDSVRVQLDVRMGSFRALGLVPRVVAWTGEPVEVGLDPEERFDLGVHGLYLDAAGGVWVLPGEAVTRGLNTFDDLARYAAGEAGLRVADLRGGLAKPFRFDAFSAIEVGGGRGVACPRGNVLAGEPTAASLREACLAGGRWLLGAQREDGSFHYVYEALKDRYEDRDYNVVRHAGAVVSLLELHEATGDESFLAGARAGLGFLASFTREGPGFSYVQHAGNATLGASALACLANVELARLAEGLPEGAQARDRAQALGRFLLSMQRRDGSFRDRYLPADDPVSSAADAPGTDEALAVSVYFPGEACLTLARLHALTGETRWLEAAVRGAGFLIEERRRGATTIVNHWLLRALVALFPVTADRRHADFVLRECARVLEFQKDSRTTVFEDFVGGITDGEIPRGAETAGVCEGLVAGYELSRMLGEPSPALRAGVLAAARFQLHHQYRPETAYWLPAPARSLGGFRSSLLADDVRIDFVQHNITSLLGAARLLDAEAASEAPGASDR